MSTSSEKLELWRRQRAQRRARAAAAEMRRKPNGVRAGGNPLTIAAAYAHRDDLTPFDAPVTGRPIPKHVTQNTHRVGSIAWSFFYRYILPGA